VEAWSIGLSWLVGIWCSIWSTPWPGGWTIGGGGARAGLEHQEARTALYDELVRCRETAYAVLHPLAVGDEPAAKDLAVLRELVEDAVRKASLVSSRPLTWRADTVADQMRLAVWRLFEDEDLNRLRQCDDDDCGWLFLDRSKNGSRRWCSSADCGNRARARRHYQRRHAGAWA
jgi:predicted RNA-binding Zn ribbon-like protein